MVSTKRLKVYKICIFQNLDSTVQFCLTEIKGGRLFWIANFLVDVWQDSGKEKWAVSRRSFASHKNTTAMCHTLTPLHSNGPVAKCSEYFTRLFTRFIFFTQFFFWLIWISVDPSSVNQGFTVVKSSYKKSSLKFVEF